MMLFLKTIIFIFYVSFAFAKTQHALSLFGDIKYKKDFKHFSYVNPNSSKGGEITLSATGGFDSLNNFNGKGNPAPALNLLYDSLMKSSLDEPASEYGLLAKSVKYPKNYSWVEYDLRPEAVWSDGKSVTPEDVIFTFDLLKTKGNPIYRYYYANIKSVTKKGKYSVRFDFDSKGNRELPLITGQLTILPKHYWENKDFTKALTTNPVGSGPYEIDSFSFNRSIKYKRRKDYWAKDLPVNKGYYNFDYVNYEIYRDAAVGFEAFKSGIYDVRWEFSAKNWAKGYDFPAVKTGEVIKKTYKDLHPKPMQGLIFNLRRDLFKDPALRKALDLTLNFEWLNKSLFFSSYKRTKSFFQESELAAKDIISNKEKVILKNAGFDLDILPEDKVFLSYREKISYALDLLKDNGYYHENGLLYNPNNKPVKFEILNSDPSFERVLLPIAQGMKRIGVDVNVRTIDLAHYTRRAQKFDFDMIMSFYSQSSSPGNEQREYWGSSAAGRNGSRNYAGIKSKVVDSIIERLIFAKNRKDLITSSRALDRVLQNKNFLIPLWYSPVNRIAFKSKFGRPKITDGYSVGGNIHTWWKKD